MMRLFTRRQAKQQTLRKEINNQARRHLHRQRRTNCPTRDVLIVPRKI